MSEGDWSSVIALMIARPTLAGYPQSGGTLSTTNTSEGKSLREMIDETWYRVGWDAH
jgi:hypothetical protein